MKAEDILKRNYPPSILIYGSAGAGKTALVSQLSGGYMFDFDRGMRTAATLKDKFFDARSKIEFDDYRDEDPMKPVAYFGAMKKLREIVTEVGARKWKYDACIIDSLTGMCKAGQLFIQGLGDKSNPMADPLAKMEVQNWGSLIAEIEKMLTLLRSLKVLTVVTAHIDIMETKKEGKGVMLGETEVAAIHPMSATKSHGANKLMWLFDEVLYADARPAGQNKMNYSVSGTPTLTIKARTRSSIGTVIHNEIGMKGLLEQMGYHYGVKA